MDSKAYYDLCLFAENFIPQFHFFNVSGGGISIIGDSEVGINRSTFLGNSTDDGFSVDRTGGGCFIEGMSKVAITNSTFTFNQAALGAAIDFSLAEDTITIVGNTILDNTATYFEGDLYGRVDNSKILLSNNLISELGVGFETGSYFSLGYNFIVELGFAQIFSSIGDQFETDPIVKPLAYNGGPRNQLQLDTFDIEWFLPTYAPRANSPLLGAGQPLEETKLLTDQRGFSRSIGGGGQQIDIGAFESQKGFAQTPVKALCTEDDYFNRLERIVLRDSTGGGFEYGEAQTLILRLSDGLIFNLASTPIIECSGNGLSNCSLSFDEQELTITYDRTYDTTLNMMSIIGLEVRAESETEAGIYALQRTGGNAALNSLAIEDSIQYATIYALPTYHIAEGAYDESFEIDDGFWLPDGDASIWQYGTPMGETIDSAASGTSAWMTLLDERYPADDTSGLASPCFDLTGIESSLISFNRWGDMQAGLDGVVLQQSKDRGANWTTVGDNQQNEGLGWYNSNAIVANPANQASGRQYGWTGRDGNWRDARILLTDLDPEELLRFRFAFASIPAVSQTTSNDGFAFDDFFVGEGGQRKVLVEQFVGTEANNPPSRLDSIIADNEFLIPIKYALEGDLYEAYPIGADVRAFYYGISETGFSSLQGKQYLGPTTELDES
ncbi:MAG: choice-of-anchor Q domain-containing protein, partial [Bacteroidota bacterium]